MKKKINYSSTDVWLGKECIYLTLKAQSINGKISVMDPIRLKPPALWKPRWRE
jgi:hypothetical protein